MNFHLHRFDYYPNTNTPLGHNFVWPKLPAFEHEKYIKLGIKDMLAYCILGKVCHYVVCVCVAVVSLPICFVRAHCSRFLFAVNVCLIECYGCKCIYRHCHLAHSAVYRVRVRSRIPYTKC